MNATEHAVKRLQIRKYPNRRYYDTTRSQHLTLEQIYSLIREGYEVHVVDSKSGQDITAKILAQIIIDLDSPKLGVFPVTMLHRLLQTNTEIVRQFVDRYFNQPLSAFLGTPWGMGEYLRHVPQASASSTAAADWTRLALGPFNPSFWAGPQSGTPAVAPSDAKSRDQVRKEISALREQLSELEAQLSKAPSTGARRKRK